MLTNCSLMSLTTVSQSFGRVVLPERAGRSNLPVRISLMVSSALSMTACSKWTLEDVAGMLNRCWIGRGGTMVCGGKSRRDGLDPGVLLCMDRETK